MHRSGSRIADGASQVTVAGPQRWPWPGAGRGQRHCQGADRLGKDDGYAIIKTSDVMVCLDG
jgi:hypothetical protein